MATPQFVIDGVRDIECTNRATIIAAFRRSFEGIPMHLSITDESLRVVLGAHTKVAPCEVFLFAYLSRVVSAISHGENAGRTLEGFNIVRAMVSLCEWDGHEESLGMPVQRLPADAGHVAVIVQQAGPGQIVGSARIALR